MSVAVCPVVPFTTPELSETDPGFAVAAAAPVAATPVAVAAFGAGIALGVAVSVAIGETSPVLE
ncbi:hypothetical protein [Streptomyces sp. NPDC014894]|uniref:hypothetical protein n=1 Tax=unclassified Streptomyces TaxID=2593676 RepID=UPI00370286AE